MHTYSAVSRVADRISLILQIMCHILLKNQILYFSGRLDGISSEKNVEKECTISVGGCEMRAVCKYGFRIHRMRM